MGLGLGDDDATILFGDGEVFWGDGGGHEGCERGCGEFPFPKYRII